MPTSWSTPRNAPCRSQSCELPLTRMRSRLSSDESSDSLPLTLLPWLPLKCTGLRWEGLLLVRNASSPGCCQTGMTSEADSKRSMNRSRQDTFNIKQGDSAPCQSAPGSTWSPTCRKARLAPLCPACGDPSGALNGGNLYRQNISCCNRNPIFCGVLLDFDTENGNKVGPTGHGVHVSDPTRQRWYWVRTS